MSKESAALTNQADVNETVNLWFKKDVNGSRLYWDEDTDYPFSDISQEAINTLNENEQVKRQLTQNEWNRLVIHDIDLLNGHEKAKELSIITNTEKLHEALKYNDFDRDSYIYGETEKAYYGEMSFRGETKPHSEYVTPIEHYDGRVCIEGKPSGLIGHYHNVDWMTTCPVFGGSQPGEKEGTITGTGIVVTENQWPISSIVRDIPSMFRLQGGPKEDSITVTIEDECFLLDDTDKGKVSCLYVANRGRDQK